MKTLEKADKEAKKAADEGSFNAQEHGRRSFLVGEFVIQYFGNGGNTPQHSATNFYVRRVDQQDDISADYWAGSFHKTLTAAIRYARAASGQGRRIAS